MYQVRRRPAVFYFFTHLLDCLGLSLRSQYLNFYWTSCGWKTNANPLPPSWKKYFPSCFLSCPSPVSEDSFCSGALMVSCNSYLISFCPLYSWLMLCIIWWISSCKLHNRTSSSLDPAWKTCTCSFWSSFSSSAGSFSSSATSSSLRVSSLIQLWEGRAKSAPWEPGNCWASVSTRWGPCSCSSSCLRPLAPPSSGSLWAFRCWGN